MYMTTGVQESYISQESHIAGLTIKEGAIKAVFASHCGRYGRGFGRVFGESTSRRIRN